MAHTTRPSLLPLEDRCVPATLYGLTNNNALIRFESNLPGATTAALSVSGLQGGAGEVLQGLDFRPRTGQLFALSVVSGVTDTLRLYRVKAVSGAATQVGSSFEVASGTFYSMDFNPTVDRIRITNSAGENLRINPNDGARADAPVNDSDLTVGALIDAVAYDRNFDSGFAVANRTTLYGLNRATNQLVTIGGINQSPSPNGGLVSSVGDFGVSIAEGSGAGFDITARNQAFATFTVGSETKLYEIDLAAGIATPQGLVGDGTIALRGIAAAPEGTISVGSDAGSPGRVRTFNSATKAQILNLAPYGTFTGGVRVASGDINGDGFPDLVTAAGPGGGPHIRAFDGISGLQIPGAIGSFFAYDAALRGGVHIAMGDINGDGFKDIITGADAGGGPHVRAFSGVDGSVLTSFFAYDPALRSGVRVAAGDLDLDGEAEIVTGAGAGGGPHIRVFDATGTPFASASLPNFVNGFFAYDSAYRGGVTVAVGDISGDGIADIVTGTGPGGGPHVRGFSGVNNAVVANFFAFPSTYRGGVRVALADSNADGRLDLQAGPGIGLASIAAFDGPSGGTFGTLTPFETSFLGGVFVGGARH